MAVGGQSPLKVSKSQVDWGRREGRRGINGEEKRLREVREWQARGRLRTTVCTVIQDARHT